MLILDFYDWLTCALQKRPLYVENNFGPLIFYNSLEF